MSKRNKRKSLNSSSSGNNSSLSMDSGGESFFVPVSDLPEDSPLLVQGNLTGIPRRLKDISADWFNARIKWKNKCAVGFQICSQIGNIKNDGFVMDEHLPKTLEPLCDDLLKIVEGLRMLVDKMVVWKNSLIALQNLLESQSKGQDIIFQTWRISNFTESAEKLSEMYQSELSVKNAILENICHTKNKHEVMHMLSAWSHEPYINDMTLLLIDGMVTETGHS